MMTGKAQAIVTLLSQPLIDHSCSPTTQHLRRAETTGRSRRSARLQNYATNYQVSGGCWSCCSGYTLSDRDSLSVEPSSDMPNNAVLGRPAARLDTILSPFRNSRKREAMRYFGARLMLPHTLTHEQHVLPESVLVR